MDVNRLKNIKNKQLEVAELTNKEYEQLEKQIEKFSKEKMAAFGMFDEIKSLQYKFLSAVENISDDQLQEMLEYYTEKDYYNNNFIMRIEFFIPNLQYYFAYEREKDDIYKKSITLRVDNYANISFGYYPSVNLVQFSNDISNIKYSCYVPDAKDDKIDINIFQQFIENIKETLLSKELKYQTGVENYNKEGYFLQNYSLFDNQTDFMQRIINTFVNRLEEFGCQIVDVSDKEQKSDTYYITIKNPMYE